MDPARRVSKLKKLVIFLIPLIVSIPAFAKEKSSFTENFSLVKDLGSNNRGFFNFKISFPSSYLFFNENKRHSRQYQAFQKFRFHQYSERTPLSRIATVEDERQNWGDMYNLIYGQQENISSEEESEYLAEFYLKRLAERSKKSRKIAGSVALAVGGGSIVLGALMPSKTILLWPFYPRAIFIISGAASVGAGILALSITSRAEREFKKVISISDPAQRERASHEALSSLAARAKKGRIIMSAVFAGVGASLTLITGSLGPAVFFGGFTVPVLLFKSREERAFQDYLKERESKQRKELALHVGIMPYGGVKIGLVYSF